MPHQTVMHASCNEFQDPEICDPTFKQFCLIKLRSLLKLAIGMSKESPISVQKIINHRLRGDMSPWLMLGTNLMDWLGKK